MFLKESKYRIAKPKPTPRPNCDKLKAWARQDYPVNFGTAFRQNVPEEHLNMFDKWCEGYKLEYSIDGILWVPKTSINMCEGIKYRIKE